MGTSALMLLALLGGPVEVQLTGDQTGTGEPELFEYVLPADLDAGGARPLLVARHGYGAPAKRPAKVSTLDEAATARGWIYMSPTGVSPTTVGTEVAQQNVAAAIAWMQDEFEIDPDRIYMVGFSMGALASANFAARHLDPEGLMIAGLGLASGVYDVTEGYDVEPLYQLALESPDNLGTSPDLEPFAYQEVSVLHLEDGVPSLEKSLARNLATVATYVTWDEDDTIPLVAEHGPLLAALLADEGGPTLVRPVTGTEKPHSWDVLDVEELLDFLAPQVAVRMPQELDVLLAESGRVGPVAAARDAADAFATVALSVDPAAGEIVVEQASNVVALTVSGERAGLAPGAPARVRAEAPAESGFLLRLIEFGGAPSYVLDAQTGALVPGVESEPGQNALTLAVPAGVSLDLDVVTVPWTGRLALTPDPAAPGAVVSVDLRAPEPAPGMAYVFGGTTEVLAPISSKLTLALLPETLVAVRLGPDGTSTLGTTVPGDPALSGAALLIQAVLVPDSGAPPAISNRVRFDIE